MSEQVIWWKSSLYADGLYFCHHCDKYVWQTSIVYFAWIYKAKSEKPQPLFKTRTKLLGKHPDCFQIHTNEVYKQFFNYYSSHLSASLRSPPYDVSLASSTCDCFQAAPLTRFLGQWQSTNTLRRTRLFRKWQWRGSWVFVRHFIGWVTGDIHVSTPSGVRYSTAFSLPRSNRGNKDTKGRLRLDEEEPVLLRRFSSFILHFRDLTPHTVSLTSS